MAAFISHSITPIGLVPIYGRLVSRITTNWLDMCWHRFWNQVLSSGCLSFVMIFCLFFVTYYETKRKTQFSQHLINTCIDFFVCFFSSLFRTGIDFNSHPLTKAYECLSHNSKSIMDSIESKPLSATLLAYIQVFWNTKTYSDNNWYVILSQEFKCFSSIHLIHLIFFSFTKQTTKPLKILNGNTSETTEKVLNYIWHNSDAESHQRFGREVLSYAALSRYLSDDKDSAKSLAQNLFKTYINNLFETPISCYAIIKLWPLFKYKTSASVEVWPQR